VKNKSHRKLYRAEKWLPFVKISHHLAKSKGKNSLSLNYVVLKNSIQLLSHTSKGTGQQAIKFQGKQ